MRQKADPISKLEEFQRLCRQQGLPVTVQRRVVLEALVGREDHPTAEQIFDSVSVRVPGISRTTVYRILETFVRIGVARKVSHPGAAARFETEMRPHHHLLCLQCGKMTDLVDSTLDRIPLESVAAGGFELADYSIQFRGDVCELRPAAFRQTEREGPRQARIIRLFPREGEREMKTGVVRWLALTAGLAAGISILLSQETGKRPSSYAPVVIHEDFQTIMSRMSAAKADIMKRQTALLEQRYDLSNRPAKGVTMSKGKAVQEGVRVKLPSGVTWERLGQMSADEIRAKEQFPEGFFPLPHPNHPEGGMIFPRFLIDEIKKQEQRDLTRFDLDFDLPDHFLPEFPAPIYLTTRPDLGDVSQGKQLTIDNFFEIFNGILNPKQLEGLRLLLTPFPQQQFNQTEDRRSERPSRGVACFDCHANGHTNGAAHLVGDIRPQEFRHRIETPTLRGVNIQRLFGSQRALKSVEDFTEFEQRAAYFDGDPVTATKKGVNPLDRGSQVHFMAEFQALLDFPPAPKLGIDGKLDPKKASAEERRGQELFFGKAQCGTCHPAPYYTDNLMHNLQVERFYKPKTINGMMASADGPIKTFPLRGIKDSPPYMHDGRLLTLEDTVEFFNIISGLALTQQEKADLVAFMRAL